MPQKKFLILLFSLSLIIVLPERLHATSMVPWDYSIKVVQPKLEKDLNTTFLVDFSQGKSALGAAEISAPNAVLVPMGGFKGAFTVKLGKEFNPAAWTAEAILRIPAGANEPV